jgi:hypothetical protein
MNRAPVIIECEDCGDEYEDHWLAMPPHLCAECEAGREDRYLEQQESENESNTEKESNG